MPQIYDMGPTALLPLRRKACWGFFRPKNPTAGFEPANLGTKDQHASPRPLKPIRNSKEQLDKDLCGCCWLWEDSEGEDEAFCLARLQRFVSLIHFRGLIRRPPRVLLDIVEDGRYDLLADQKEVPTL